MPDDRLPEELRIARTVVTSLAGDLAEPDVAALRRVRDKLRVTRSPRRGPGPLLVPIFAAAAVVVVALTVAGLVLRPLAPAPTPGDSAQPPTAGPSTAPADVWQSPLRYNYILTSMFDPSWNTGVDYADRHWGPDMAAPLGTPIYAVHEGTVTVAGPWGNYGLGIEIDHGDGVTSRYGHASRVLVTVGEHVGAGQVIALVGQTGLATGPHLHFEIRINGVFYDPAKWMKDHGVDITTGHTGSL